MCKRAVRWHAHLLLLGLRRRLLRLLRVERELRVLLHRLWGAQSELSKA